MTARSFSKPLALCVALMTMMALVLPLAGTALANHGARTLDVEPETDTNQAGDNHTLTATLSEPVTASSGSINIDFEIESGPGDEDGATHTSPDLTCTVSYDPTAVTGQDDDCTVTYTSEQVGTDQIRAWIDHDKNNATVEADLSEPLGPDDTDNTDVVSKTWIADDAAVLDCEPETAVNPSSGAGSSELYTCRVTDEFGNPIQGAHVDGENMNGANDPDSSPGNPNIEGPQDEPDYDHETSEPETEEGGHFCITGADGTCQDAVEAIDSESGTAAICFFASEDPPAEGDPSVYNPLSTQQGQGGNCDSETQSDDDGDMTDVVFKVWENPAQPYNLNCEPETDTNNTGDTHTVTCTVATQQGTTAHGVNIDVEATGANDPDGGNSPTSPDFTCTTREDNPSTTGNEAGTCTFSHTGSGVGTTTYRAWVDTDGNNATDNSDTAEGQNEAAAPGNQGEPDKTDVVTKNWVNQNTAAALNCEPETATNETGDTHRITCTATNSQGGRVGGANVDAEATGANDPDNSNTPSTPDFTCTTASDDDPTTTNTNEQGTCSFTHTGNSAGTTTYRAWVDSDGNNETTSNEVDMSEGRNEETAPGSTERPEPDTTDVVEKTWVERIRELDCEPENDTNETGDSHTITCTVTSSQGDPVSGVRVHAEATGANDPDNSNTPSTPDFTCTTRSNDPLTPTTDETGTCSFTHSGNTNNPGTTTYRAWVDRDNNSETSQGEVDTTEGRDAQATPGTTPEPDTTDVVEKQWVEPPKGLNCEPETDTNPQRTSHTITCTATDDNGRMGGARIHAEATGANDPDDSNSPQTPEFTCTTAQQDNLTTPDVNEQGRCSFTHGPGESTAEAGTTTYRAWIDEDNNASTFDGDPNEGPNAGAANDTTQNEPGASGTIQPGTTAEPDNTDVVTKNWVPAPATLTISPKSDTAKVGTCNPYTITARDANGNPASGAIIDVEQRHARSADRTNGNEPRVLFCRPQASEGSNPSDVNTEEGDLSPPEESPDNPGTLGGETVQPTNQNGQVTIGIAVQPANGSDGSGNVNIIVFYEEDDDNDDPDNDEPQDSATKTWEVPEGRTITCSPREASNPTGTNHTVTCTVRDREGAPAQGEPVVWSESGPGEFTSNTSGTTNQNGQVSATTRSDEDGVQSITATLASDTGPDEPNNVDECDRAANDPQGAPAGNCSDTVTKTWVEGDSPQCADGVDNDNDGRTDHPNDPGCSSAEDNTESPDPGPEPGACADGVDNDGDGNTDFPDDTGCTSEADSSETGPVVTSGPCAGFNESSSTPRDGGGSVIVGTNGPDDLRGTGGDDLICALGGRDAVRGAGGDDTIYGGGGHDDIRGNAGNDTLFGQSGLDVMRGGHGSDVVRGGGQDDTMRGYTGNDRMWGGGGNDTLRAGDGRDRLRGNKGDDLLDGGGGRDNCRGGAGRDRSFRCER